VVVVDKELRVKGWNKRAEDLWGLRQDEVDGEHFLNLDFGLHVDRLRQPIRSILSGEQDSQTLRMDAVNRRGRSVQVDIGFSPLGTDRNVRGVILMMQTVDEASQGSAG
jgi:two-component system CheB/CheR fusion protein